MTPEQCKRVDELFIRATALPAVERAAFIRAQAGDDPGIVAEVESLLAHATPRFLEDPEHLRALDAERPTSDHPLRIDRYDILRVLGEGGMGVVYLAAQTEPVRRTVAVKRIKLGMDTRQVVARFEGERQALALMTHPSIAQVYDAGSTDQGRPYFVMEYVDGVPLTCYCDDAGLDVDRRLALFTQVCDGIQHAHQKGIIHRDIKPSNVLVTEIDGSALPKIIDFGIARATNHRAEQATAFTELGQIVGTPEYMSPEQADLAGDDIDTRTDVYSLGVLLYELLVGELPFDAEELRRSGYDELCRKIRDVDPVKPSERLSRSASAGSGRPGTDPLSLARRLRGDLDWVILKALEKDRARRYDSASELAADIRRHLAHEPVQARPPGTLYRMSKFVRRHRLGVVAATLLLIVLIGGVVGTSLGMLRARAAEAVARGAEAQAQEEAARAGREAKTARGIVDVVTGSIRGMPADAAVRGEFLRELGRAYRRQGLYREARPLFEESVALLREAHGDENPALLESVNLLGALAADLQEHAEAVRHFERALPIAERLFGADDAEYVAVILKNLGDAHENLGQLDAARRYLQRTLDIRVKHFGADSAQAAVTTSSIANVLLKGGNFDEGVRLHRESLRIRKQVSPDRHRFIGYGYFFLGQAQHQAGRLQAAVGSLESAVEEWRLELGDEHADVAAGLFELAKVRAELGDGEAALQLLRRARAIDDASFDPRDPDEAPSLLESLEEHAALFQQLGHSADAQELRERARRIRGRDAEG